MFLEFRHFAPKRRAYYVSVFKRAAVAASLTAIAALSGCGGGPKPGDPVSTKAGAFTITAKLPAATEGVSYTGTVTASGGTSPYKFAVTSGQMPQGMNLDQTTGSVTGTPSAAGNFNFGITVSDATGASAQVTMQIVVAQSSASPPPTQPPPSSPTKTIFGLRGLTQTMWLSPCGVSKPDHVLPPFLVL